MIKTSKEAPTLLGQIVKKIFLKKWLNKKNWLNKKKLLTKLIKTSKEAPTLLGQIVHHTQDFRDLCDDDPHKVGSNSSDNNNN